MAHGQAWRVQGARAQGALVGYRGEPDASQRESCLRCAGWENQNINMTLSPCDAHDDHRNQSCEPNLAMFAQASPPTTHCSCTPAQMHPFAANESACPAARSAAPRRRRGGADSAAAQQAQHPAPSTQAQVRPPSLLVQLVQAGRGLTLGRNSLPYLCRNSQAEAHGTRNLRQT